MENIILKNKPKEEVLEFIREKLSFDESVLNALNSLKYNNVDLINEHRRFEMSGYNLKNKLNTLHNLNILNEFAYLGIYDYSYYLFLDFYKGNGTLFIKYFYEEENLEIELSGLTTSEIIYEIFKYTIFTDKKTRRRN
jgi:hypothetical protein